MTEAVETRGPRAPWWFWLVAALSAAWNAFGAYDYTMAQLKGDAYLQAAGMRPDQIAYFHSMPTWTTAVWALGVWGAVAGSGLLFARSRWALHAFTASLAGLVLSLVYTHLMSKGGEIMGQTGVIMNSVILAGCLIFVWYAARVTKQGLLR
ncbi:MAG TPA: hypothetical protein PK913_05320 [Phenylobacterium sp.]|nr:hypothetical protein [Phenylobacterium sp.]HQP20790.1 hypothetical protein [Phenylobacterium sp.]